MRLRNQWLLLCVTLLLKVCTFFALCLALYVQPKSLHHHHEHIDSEKNTTALVATHQKSKKDFLTLN